jgi:ABC-type transport system involved in multi-copper enzyme maturation permease subunit
VIAIARFAIRECVRRRIFVVVAVLTVLFVGLYGLACSVAFDWEVGFEAGVDPKALTGATLLGLAMFGTLFLGAVLAAFLTLGVVRGDAERGLLQPVLVRPVSRAQVLAARLAAACAVAGTYTIVLFVLTVLVTGIMGGWWPDRLVAPALALGVGVCCVAAISVFGSVFLSATTNGIAVFMTFGAGLVAGLLGQIGRGLNAQSLEDVATVASWALPFEALYQDALGQLTADAGGLTRLILDLGPFGGAREAGALLWPWALAYLVLVTLAAAAAFRRRDL